LSWWGWWYWGWRI